MMLLTFCKDKDCSFKFVILLLSLLVGSLIEGTGDNGPLSIARKTGLPLIRIQLQNE